MQRELVKAKISEESAKNKGQGRTKSRRRRVSDRDSSKLRRRLSPRSKARGQFRYWNNHFVIHTDSSRLYIRRIRLLSRSYPWYICIYFWTFYMTHRWSLTFFWQKVLLLHAFVLKLGFFKAGIKPILIYYLDKYVYLFEFYYAISIQVNVPPSSTSIKLNKT